MTSKLSHTTLDGRADRRSLVPQQLPPSHSTAVLRPMAANTEAKMPLRPVQSQ